MREQAEASYDALQAEQRAHWQQDLEHYRMESKRWQTGNEQLKGKDLLTIRRRQPALVQQLPVVIPMVLYSREFNGLYHPRLWHDSGVLCIAAISGIFIYRHDGGNSR